MDYTFDGRLNWAGVFANQCLATDIQADAFEKNVFAAFPNLTQVEKGRIADWTVILSCSVKAPAVIVKPGDPPILRDFADGFNRCKEMTPEAFLEWRLHIPFQIVKAVEAAFEKSQDLFPVPLAQVPSSVLTEDQKADPNLEPSAEISPIN